MIKYPLSTEKSIRLMESENKLVFIVDRRSKKQEIKEEIENKFKILFKVYYREYDSRVIKKLKLECAYVRRLNRVHGRFIS